MSDLPPASATAASVARRSLPAWLAPTFLVLLSLGLYAPSLKYNLVYDDAFLIQKNSLMTPVQQSFLATFSMFRHEYWDGVGEDRPEILRQPGQALYRPLTLFIWAVIVNVSGIQPVWPFHLLSVVANAAVVLLLHRVVLRLWRNPRLAFVAAFLFALHPLHAEAVTYVAGLSDVISTAAVLAGLLLWERATRDRGVLCKGAFAGLLATLFVGLLAKEQAVVLIAAIVLADLMLRARGENRDGVPRAAVYAGLLLVLAAHLLVRYAAMGYLKPSSAAISRLDNPLIQEPFVTRLLTGGKVLALEVWLFLWPERLSVDYSFNAIPVARSLHDPAAAAGLILGLLLLVYGLIMLRRSPALGWGVLFFLGCALFTSSVLVPIGTIFGERLMYISSAGACLAVAAILDPLLREHRIAGSGNPAAGGVNALGLLFVLGAGSALGLRTWERNKDFETSDRLFDSALEVVPDSARVHYQLATLQAQQKLFTKAEEHFERSLAIDDSFIPCAIGIGDVHTAAKNFEKAIATYDRILSSLKLSPTGGSQETLAEIQRLVYIKRAGAKAGKGDLNGAAADLRTATQLGGGLESFGVSPHVQLAQLQMNRGKPEEAIPVLKQGLQLDPQNLNALYLLARAAFTAEDKESYEQAVAGLGLTKGGETMALAMKAEELYNDAASNNDVKGIQQAIDMFEKVREAQPELAMPYMFRARFMFEKGRFADAIVEADRALERAPRHPMALLLKAMSQNGAGEAKEALATTQELALIAPNVACYTAMATAHFMLGDVDALEGDYKKLKELGSEPIEIIFTRALALENAGRIDDAIAAVEQGRLIPEFRQDWRLLRQLGILLIEAGRHDEALDALQQQDVAQRAQPDQLPDEFLPINRARAYMGLNRDMEAAAQLELFESSISPESNGWPSLLHRRAELFLKRGSTFYDPAAATVLCEEGLLKTRNRYPPLLDRSIEALVATGDLAAAIVRAQLAAKEFPEDKRYEIAEAALTRAQAGDKDGAAAQLRKLKDAALTRIADKLQG